jgi:ankyrin repeat protein
MPEQDPFELGSLHISSFVGLQQLPIEVLEIISSYLEFRDSVNFYECSSRISPSVLSCSKSPTFDDLFMVQNDTRLLECVLKYSKVTNQTLQTFFYENLEKETVNNDVIEILAKDQRIDPSADDNSAIREASGNGHTEVVELLLNDPRVDPSASDNDAIRWASGEGQTAVVELLLNDPRVDPSANVNEAIRWASGNGRTAVVELLLNDPRVDPNACNNDAIREASRAGHTEVVKLLINDPRVDPSAVMSKQSD